VCDTGAARVISTNIDVCHDPETHYSSGVEDEDDAIVDTCDSNSQHEIRQDRAYCPDKQGGCPSYDIGTKKEFVANVFYDGFKSVKRLYSSLFEMLVSSVLLRVKASTFSSSGC
jgi:hypothetical protein